MLPPPAPTDRNLTQLYVTWVDPAAYAAHTRASYGGRLPFPANHLVPLVMSRDVIRRNARALVGLTEREALAAAAECYESLALLLQDGRAYLAGDRPTSLDALVYAHLAYHMRSPMAKELLRPMVRARAPRGPEAAARRPSPAHARARARGHLRRRSRGTARW